MASCRLNRFCVIPVIGRVTQLDYASIDQRGASHSSPSEAGRILRGWSQRCNWDWVEAWEAWSGLSGSRRKAHYRVGISRSQIQKNPHEAGFEMDENRSMVNAGYPSATSRFTHCSTTGIHRRRLLIGICDGNTIVPGIGDTI